MNNFKDVLDFRFNDSFSAVGMSFFWFVEEILRISYNFSYFPLLTLVFFDDI